MLGQKQAQKKIAPKKVGPLKVAPVKAEEYSIISDLLDGDREQVIKVRHNGIDRFRFECDQQTSPFCCGLIELGNFSISKNGKGAPVPKDKKLSAIKQLLNEIVSQDIRGKQVKTFYFTTIAGQELIDEALADGTLFTHVKTFTNTTGSINKLYISNA